MNQEKSLEEILSQLYWIQLRHHQFEPPYSEYINLIQGVCKIWQKGLKKGKKKSDLRIKNMKLYYKGALVGVVTI